jgi:hypothetical protein
VPNRFFDHCAQWPNKQNKTWLPQKSLVAKLKLYENNEYFLQVELWSILAVSKPYLTKHFFAGYSVSI